MKHKECTEITSELFCDHMNCNWSKKEERKQDFCFSCIINLLMRFAILILMANWKGLSLPLRTDYQ